MAYNKYQYRKKSEASEQETIIALCKFREQQHPELKLLHHCPNGGSRNRIEAINLKRQGVKAGVSDLHLPVPKGAYASLYIELKYGRNTLSTEQKEWLQNVAEYKNYAVTCYGADVAMKVIEEYINLKPGQEMSIENNAIIRPKPPERR